MSFIGCIHGLEPPESCAHCYVPRSARKKKSSVRTFTARYDGWCRHCSDSIEPGDVVGYLEDELACIYCIEAS